MSCRTAVMRKTTVAAQIVTVNTFTAGSVVQLCHLGLPRHFFDAFICQSVEDKVKNSWGNTIHGWPGSFRLQLRNNAKQKKGKGQLLDQLICLASLSGDMPVRMGKFISKLVKTPGKALSNKSFLLFQAREAAEKWRWYFQLQNIFYVLLSPAQVTPKFQDTTPEAEYFKVSKSHTRQLGCPSVKFLTNNSITLQVNQINLLWMILPRSHSTIHEGMQCLLVTGAC